MKKTIFTLAMLCCAIVGNAQVTDEQSAILQVGDNAQIFYGTNALVEALEAAPDRGATITLSSGTFAGGTMTKCVNIYGAGWVEQKIARNNDNPSDNSILPTNISSRLTISIPEELTAPHNIHIEGIGFPNYGTGFAFDKAIDGLEIMKCMANTGYIALDFAAENKNVVVTQCHFAGATGLDDVLFQNCYLENSSAYHCRNINTSNVVINHCIISGWYSFGGDVKALFTNCMIYSGYGISPASTARNCMFIVSNITNVGSEDNIFSVDYNLIFEDATGIGYTDARTFKIKDELVDTYMGGDGTQIGINGGNYNWNKAPHTPLVTDLKLAIDGTNLKVTYNAETR